MILHSGSGELDRPQRILYRRESSCSRTMVHNLGERIATESLASAELLDQRSCQEGCVWPPAIIVASCRS